MSRYGPWPEPAPADVAAPAPRVKPVTAADFDKLVEGLCDADPAHSAARAALNAQHKIDMADPEYVRNYENWIYKKREREQPRERRREEFDQPLVAKKK